MKSLKTSILESVQNIDVTDMEVADTIYAFEKTKLNSGKQVYWASASELPKCTLPGLGEVNTNNVKRNILPKLEQYIAEGLKIDTEELYGKFNYRDYYKRTIESRIHMIYDCKTKAQATKMEKALDYIIVVRFGFAGDTESEFDERKLQMNLAKLFGISTNDVLCETKSTMSGVLNDKGEKFSTTWGIFYSYMTYEELEKLLNKI